MNPYYNNWNYGYTLAPATEQTRGAYATYSGYQPAAGANAANLAAVASGQDSTTHWQQQGAHAYAGQSAPLRAQTFISSTSKTLKQETPDVAPAIGPVQPSPQQLSNQVTPAMALSKLHELAMANKLVERFEKTKDPEAGNPAATEYEVKLFIGTEVYEASAASVKLAKQNAALKALANTKYQTLKEKKFTMFKTANRIGVTATSELHEIAAKKGVHIDFKFLEPYNFEFKHSMRMWSKKDMLGNYRVQLNVAGYEFYGQAELPQQAKHNASTQALAVVRAMPDPAGAGKTVAKPGGVPEAEASKAPEAVTTEVKNTTMLLNEIAIINNCTPDWTLVSETGPSHARIYKWQLTIGEFTTLGEGNSKKMARQAAADQMISTLPEEWKAKAKRNVKQIYSGMKRGRAGSFGPPHKKKSGGGGDDVKIVISSTNPISCLHEYAKKKKIADPSFDVIGENVLETIQKGPGTYKKMEYYMQCSFNGRTYQFSAPSKKAAKTGCAAEAWDTVRAELEQ